MVNPRRTRTEQPRAWKSRELGPGMASFEVVAFPKNRCGMLPSPSCFAFGLALHHHHRHPCAVMDDEAMSLARLEKELVSQRKN